MADKTEEKRPPKVKNLSGKKVPILQYVVMPDGRAVKKFSGEVLPELPHDVAETLQCKRLADMGLLEIEGYKTPEVVAKRLTPPTKQAAPEPPKKEPAKEEPAPDKEEAPKATSKATPKAKPKAEKLADKPSTAKGKKEKPKETK